MSAEPVSRYHPPPDDYESPSMQGCAYEGITDLCGTPIVYVPVVGGHKWVHLTEVDPPHDVVMPCRWWDVLTGEWVDGPLSPDLAAALAEESPDA